MADAMGNSFLVVVLPLYIASTEVSGDTLGLSKEMITGIIIGLFGIVSAVLQPFTGRLSDKMGKRRVFVIFGLLLYMVSDFMYTQAHSYISLLAVRIGQGIGAAFTITATVALVSELSQDENRGGNMGVYNSFRLIGFGVGPLASGALIDKGPYHFALIGEINGFTAAFLLAAVAALVSALLVTIFVRDPKNTKPNAEKLVIHFRSREKGRILDPIFTLGLATFFMCTGFALLAPLETELNKRLSQGAFLFSIEFSALVVSLALIQPLIGKASDKYGRKIFIVAGLICLIPFTLVQGFIVAPWQMIAARALQGISAAMVFAPALALAGDLAKKGQVGAQLSVLTVAFGLGISFGAFVSGFTTRFGFVVPFIVGAALAVIGAILVSTQVPKK